MQGQKGAIGSLPESLALDHGSNKETRNLTTWSTGESSSSTVPNQAGLNQLDPKPGHPWSSITKSHTEPHQHEPATSQLSLGHAINGHCHHSHNGSLSLKTSNHASSSSGPVETEARPLTRKRKAAEWPELNIGQESSRMESPNLFQRPEGSSSSPWLSGLENPTSTSTMPFGRIIPRLGLDSSDTCDIENARRNVRIRNSNTRQQDQLPGSSINNNTQLNLLSPHSSLELNPVATTGDGLVPPMLRAPAMTRNLHVSSRNRSSNRPISSVITPSTAINWNLDSANGNGTNPVTNPGLLPSSSFYSSRRHVEFLRRSLLSSIDSGGGGGRGGGQNSNLFSGIPPPIGTSASSSSQELGLPPVTGITGHHSHHHLPHHHHLPYLRTPDRHLDDAFGFPYLSRTMAGDIERRGRMVSEIRNAMNLIRRRDGLRFEDVVILDPSVFYSMSDIHDRHRDMRLDIDNMSYEELLALEERIGNVNTGLTEENVHKHLKQKTYASVANLPDAEPCCICQEEYKDGDDMGELECGHGFHTSCIKQWLLQKKLCPVCKTDASK